MTIAALYRRMADIQRDMALGRITAVVAEQEMRKLNGQLLVVDGSDRASAP